MWKVLAVFAVIAVALAVPVAQVPEPVQELAAAPENSAPKATLDDAKVELAAPAVKPEADAAPAVEAKAEVAAEAPAAVDVKAEAPVEANAVPAAPATEAPALEAKPEEAAPSELTKLEGSGSPAVVEVQAEEASGSEAKAKSDEAAPADALDAAKQQAFEQVLSFVETLAQPLNKEEHSALKEMISAGSAILAQAETKARELQSQLGETNLLQQDGLFGMKADGTIDADAAADQMMGLLSLIAGPEAISPKEKTIIHDLIVGFAKVFSPDKATMSALQNDFGKVLGTVEQAVSKTQSHADLLDPQTLLSVFDDQTNVLQGVEMSALTKTFLSNIQNEFETATHALAELH